MRQLDSSAGIRATLGLAICVLIGLLGCASPSLMNAGDLDVVREAANRSGWAKLQAESSGILLRGEARFFGRTETFELLLGADGRYRQSIGGPLGKLEAFDGERVVRQGLAGIPRELDLGDRAEAPLLAALLSGAWTNLPGLRYWADGPIDISVERPGTPFRFELQLDPETKLPALLTQKKSGSFLRTEFTDWTLIAGALVPLRFHATDQDGGPIDQGESYRVTEALVVPLDGRSFALDTKLPRDFHFDVQQEASLEVVRTSTGHLLVRPLVEGQNVGWFLLDSGAGAMVLDRNASQSLELPPLGNVQAVGAVGSTAARFVQGRTFTLGPLTFEAPIFVELDLDFLKATFGIQVAGVVGYDLFSRAVVEIDHDQVRIFDPVSFAPQPEWASVPLAFQNKTPCALARFPASRGVAEAWFRLDTGANGAVTFHAPAVKRYGLLAHRETRLANFGGVGGGATGYFADFEWFELAGRRVKDFEAGLAMKAIGTFGDAYTAGNIGQDFFTGARLIFDYPRELLYLSAHAAKAESKSS